MRSLRWMTIASVLAVADIGHAATIPIQLDITDGVNSQHLVIDAPREDFGVDLYSYNVSGESSSETWRVEWQLSGWETAVDNTFEIPPDAGLQFNYSVYNLSQSVNSF